MPLRRCHLCERRRLRRRFIWRDPVSGATGESRRCEDCRGRARLCESCRPAGRRRCRACRDAARLPGLPRARYRIRRHALERYVERCAPHLSRGLDTLGRPRLDSQAAIEMIRLMAGAPMLIDPPEWLPDLSPAWPGYGKTEGYLLVNPDTVFVVGVPRGGRRRSRTPKVRTVLTRR